VSDPGDATRPDDEEMSGDALLDALVEFEAAPLPMYLMHTDGMVIRGNSAFRDLAGLTSEHLAGLPVWELLPLDERERARSRVETVLQGGGPLPEAGYLLVTAGGRTIAVRSSIATVRDADGGASYILGRVLRADDTGDQGTG
jgi:PAS domain S-box-containing protein